MLTRKDAPNTPFQVTFLPAKSQARLLCAERADGAGSGDDSDSDAEMDALVLRDERRMQGDGDDASSASSSSNDGGFSAPRRRCAAI